MIEVKNVEFDKNNEPNIRFVRNTVFSGEQGISHELDFDGNDIDAIHAVVLLDGRNVGTGRMLKDGHIGRIAVLRECRGKGLGFKIVLSLLSEARKENYKRVYLGSQKHAVDFYSKLGFHPYGNEYMEAGIEHISMEKILT